MDNIGAWRIARSTIGTDDPTQLLIMPVTCNFFSLYGLDRPRFGTALSCGRLRWAWRNAVVVLSEELWHSRFQADPQILGREIQLNRRPFTVVGVTPSQFSGQLRGPGVWVPYTMQPVLWGGRDLFRDDSVPWLNLEGRMKHGQSRAGVQAELAVIARQQDRLLPGRNTTIFVTNGSLVQDLRCGARCSGLLLSLWERWA